jgi:hypothetical protein
MAAEPPESAPSREAPPAVSSSPAAAVAGVGGPNPCCAKVVDPLSALTLTPHTVSFSFPAVRFLMCLFLGGWVPQLWKKYQKLETSRTALREAVKLLQAENEKLQKEKSELSKGTYSATHLA